MKLPISNPVLAPYSVYYYRFLYNQVPSRTGRFKTLPAATAELAQLKIGYVVCQDYNNGYYTALSYLALEDVEYIVHLGDYIYETITQTNAVRPIPPFPSGALSRRTWMTTATSTRSTAAIPTSRRCTKTSLISSCGTTTNSLTIAIRISIQTTTRRQTPPPLRNPHCGRREPGLE